MSKIVRLTESDLVRLVKKVMEEQSPEVWDKQEKIKTNLATQENASKKYVDEIYSLFDGGVQFYKRMNEDDGDFGIPADFRRIVKQPDGSIYMYTLDSGWAKSGSGYTIIKFTCNQPYFLTYNDFSQKIWNKKLNDYMKSKFCKR